MKPFAGDLNHAATDLGPKTMIQRVIGYIMQSIKRLGGPLTIAQAVRATNEFHRFSTLTTRGQFP